MAPLPKPFIAAPLPSILTRLRIVGAVVVVQGGQISIRNASRVPPALMAEARARRDDLIMELTGDQSMKCARCGAPSPLFSVVVNADLWECARCLPSNPDDQAYEATERAAIIGEATGNALAAIPHPMPPSWSDTSLAPTPGARCRVCTQSSWWCERDQPKGWRCGQCHPGDHLPAHMVREVRT